MRYLLTALALLWFPDMAAAQDAVVDREIRVPIRVVDPPARLEIGGMSTHPPSYCPPCPHPPVQYYQQQVPVDPPTQPPTEPPMVIQPAPAYQFQMQPFVHRGLFPCLFGRRLVVRMRPAMIQVSGGSPFYGYRSYRYR